MSTADIFSTFTIPSGHFPALAGCRLQCGKPPHLRNDSWEFPGGIISHTGCHQGKRVIHTIDFLNSIFHRSFRPKLRPVGALFRCMGWALFFWLSAGFGGHRRERQLEKTISKIQWTAREYSSTRAFTSLVRVAPLGRCCQGLLQLKLN